MSKKEPINSGVIRLFITESGQIDGEMSWNVDDKIDQEFVDALVEVLHGIMGSVQTSFEELREVGRIYQAGMDTEACRHSMTFVPDEGEEPTIMEGNIVSFPSSNSKH